MLAGLDVKGKCHSYNGHNIVVDVIVPSCDRFHTQFFAVFFLGTFRETDLIFTAVKALLGSFLHVYVCKIFPQILCCCCLSQP